VAPRGQAECGDEAAGTPKKARCPVGKGTEHEEALSSPPALRWRGCGRVRSEDAPSGVRDEDDSVDGGYGGSGDGGDEGDCVERRHGGIDEIAGRKAEVCATTVHAHAGSAVMTRSGGGGAVVVWGCGGDPWG
jgi:hypothetical protein